MIRLCEYRRCGFWKNGIVYKLEGCLQYCYYTQIDGKRVQIFFGIEYNNRPYFPCVIVNGKKYQHYRYIKKYATLQEVQELINVLKPEQ